jgi:hypothetical protein
VRSGNTPDYITELKPDEIFVFGSNKDGWHGAGAAKTAVERFAAVEGQGEGLQGQSYGLVTMSGWGELKASAQRFINFANENPQLTFYLTKVGCGIAGFREHGVSRLFKDAPANVIKPIGW